MHLYSKVLIVLIILFSSFSLQVAAEEEYSGLLSKVYITKDFNPLEDHRAIIHVKAEEDISGLRLAVFSVAGKTVFEQELGKLLKDETKKIVWSGKNKSMPLNEGTYIVKLITANDEIKDFPENPQIIIDYELEKSEIPEELLALLHEIQDTEKMKLAFMENHKEDFELQKIIMADDQKKTEAKITPESEILGLEVKAELIKTYRLYPNKVKLQKLKNELSNDEKSVIKKIEKLSLTDKKNLDARQVETFELSLSEDEKNALSRLVEKGIVYEGNPITVKVTGKVNKDFNFEKNQDKIDSEISIESFFEKIESIPLEIKFFKQKILFADTENTADKSEHLPEQIIESGKIDLDKQTIITSTIELLKMFPAEFINNHFDYIGFAGKFNEQITSQRNSHTKDAFIETENLKPNTMRLKKAITKELFRQIRKQYTKTSYEATDYFDNKLMNGRTEDIQAFLQEKCSKETEQETLESMTKEEITGIMNENCNPAEIDNFIREKHMLEKQWSKELTSEQIEEDFAEFSKFIPNYEQELPNLQFTKKEKLQTFREIMKRINGIGEYMLVNRSPEVAWAPLGDLERVRVYSDGTIYDIHHPETTRQLLRDKAEIHLSLPLADEVVLRYLDYYIKIHVKDFEKAGKKFEMTIYADIKKHRTDGYGSVDLSSGVELCKESETVKLNLVLNKRIYGCGVFLYANKEMSFHNVVEIESINIYNMEALIPDLRELEEALKKAKGRGEIKERSSENAAKFRATTESCYLLSGGSNPKINIIFTDSTKKLKREITEMVLPDGSQSPHAFSQLFPYSESLEYFNFYYTTAPHLTGHEDEIHEIGKFNCTNNKQFRASNETYYVNIIPEYGRSWANPLLGYAVIYRGIDKKLYDTHELYSAIQHELGHALCMLGDEYIEKGRVVHKWEINCYSDLYECNDDAKEFNYDKSSECFEGCGEGGFYTQWQNSIMKNAPGPYVFNPIGKKICAYRIEQDIKK